VTDDSDPQILQIHADFFSELDVETTEPPLSVLCQVEELTSESTALPELALSNKAFERWE
jgi:hypothetical protein